MKGFNRIISAWLAICLLFGVLPAQVFATEEPAALAEEAVVTEETETTQFTEPVVSEPQQLQESEPVQLAEQSSDPIEASVEQQIRAFADSIDKKNADDDAASALASHGMFGRGKKLSAGKNHALTATLLNSELTQVALTRFCEKAIRSMQQLDLDQMEFTKGNIQWGGTTDSFYLLYVFSSADKSLKEREWSLIGTTHYAKNRNEYDESLDWMAGCTAVRMSFKRAKVAANAATYQVNLEFRDRFDFATSGNSGFKDLISGLGAILFREFDWSAKVTFDLTVPYTCRHKSQNYRFTYDAENKIMTCDTSDGWQANDVTHRIYTNNNKNSDYYELAKPVRLRHDTPWVMEYDIRNPNAFGFSPLPGANYSYPVLYNNQRVLLAVCDHKRVTISKDIMNEYGLTNAYQSVRHYYGTSLNDRFTYSTKKIYTFRLENEIHIDGSNMIYLTVRETDTGTVVLDRTPMDDYYRYESWIKKRTLQDEDNAWLSGKDLIFNYIGYTEYPFSASHFELRVWENGEDGESVSYYQDKVTKPTCTAKGYTSHTCELCGYSYKDTYVAALSHAWDEGVVTTEPTEEAVGVRTYTCATCGDTKTEEIPVLEHTHRYEEVVTAPTCTEQGYTTHTCICGDSYVDTYVNATGHSFGDWTEELVPTCTEPGSQRRACANCDFYETEEVPATGHSHEKIITPPTCTEQGYTTHACACGDTFVDSYIEPLGHHHLPVVVEPTYVRLGYTEYICQCGDSYIDEDSYTDPLGLPEPEVKSQNDIETGKPVLTWTADGEADYYEVYRSTSRKKNYKSIGITEGTTFTDDGASSGKTYYYKVQAVCKIDEALDSNKSDYVSVKSRYPQPEIREVTNNSKGYPVIKWSKVKGAKKYQVYYSTTEDGVYKRLTTTSSTSYTYTGAKRDTEYYFKVRAYGSYSSYEGAFSEPADGIRKLAQPSISLSTSQTNKRITIKWKTISKALSYELQCSINGGEFKTLDVLTGTSYTHRDLLPGNRYTYRLRALRDGEETASSYSTQRYSTIRVGKPSLRITLSENGKPQLSWETVEGAVEYQVYYATSKRGKYKLVETTEELSFVYDAARKGKTCYFKVRAVDVSGKAGDYSSIRNIKSK